MKIQKCYLLNLISNMFVKFIWNQSISINYFDGFVRNINDGLFLFADYNKEYLQIIFVCLLMLHIKSVLILGIDWEKKNKRSNGEIKNRIKKKVLECCYSNIHNTLYLTIKFLKLIFYISYIIYISSVTFLIKTFILSS